MNDYSVEIAQLEEEIHQKHDKIRNLRANTHIGCKWCKHDR